VDSDYLFGNCSQRAVSRFGCGKSSVIRRTLEMLSEDPSATPYVAQDACGQVSLGSFLEKGKDYRDGKCVSTPNAAVRR
jgi:hypothetical protein